jgi:uncharacterized membrane protein YkoI
MLRTLLMTSLLALSGPVLAMQLGVGETTEYGAAYMDEASLAGAMQGGGVTLEQAIEQVRRKYKGRILSAVTKVNGNREVHEIKVLTDDGTVKTERIQGKQRS